MVLLASGVRLRTELCRNTTKPAPKHQLRNCSVYSQLPDLICVWCLPSNTMMDLSIPSAKTKHSPSSLCPRRSDTTRAMHPPWQLPQNPAMAPGCSSPSTAHLLAGVLALWGSFHALPLLCPSVHAGAEVVRGWSQLHQAGGEETAAATGGAELPPWKSNGERVRNQGSCQEKQALKLSAGKGEHQTHQVSLHPEVRYI